MRAECVAGGQFVGDTAGGRWADATFFEPRDEFGLLIVGLERQSVRLLADEVGFGLAVGVAFAEFHPEDC